MYYATHIHMSKFCHSKFATQILTTLIFLFPKMFGLGLGLFLYSQINQTCACDVMSQSELTTVCYSDPHCI